MTTRTPEQQAAIDAFAEAIKQPDVLAAIAGAVEQNLTASDPFKNAVAMAVAMLFQQPVEQIAQLLNALADRANRTETKVTDQQGRGVALLTGNVLATLATMQAPMPPAAPAAGVAPPPAQAPAGAAAAPAAVVPTPVPAPAQNVWSGALGALGRGLSAAMPGPRPPQQP